MSLKMGDKAQIISIDNCFYAVPMDTSPLDIAKVGGQKVVEGRISTAFPSGAFPSSKRYPADVVHSLCIPGKEVSKIARVSQKLLDDLVNPLDATQHPTLKPITQSANEAVKQASKTTLKKVPFWKKVLVSLLRKLTQ